MQHTIRDLLLDPEFMKYYTGGQCGLMPQNLKNKIRAKFVSYQTQFMIK